MITPEILDKQVNSFYMPSQLKAIGWDTLTYEDKQVLINRADEEFDRYQWIGHKVIETQEHAFPRVVDGQILSVEKLYRALAVYCFEAVRLMGIENSDQYNKGLTSIKVEGASESYDIGKVDISRFKRAHLVFLIGLIYRGGGR